MRRVKTFIGLSLVVLVLLSMGAWASSADNRPLLQKEQKTDAYVFPITPEKTPEQWAQFQMYNGVKCVYHFTPLYTL